MVRIINIMNGHDLFYACKITRSDITPHTKVDCQPGDCMWPLNLPQEFAWVHMGKHTHLSPHALYKQGNTTLRAVRFFVTWFCNNGAVCGVVNSCWCRQVWGLAAVTATNVNSYSASHDNWCTETLWNRVITAQCEGMGEVGSARYEPALLPPCLSIRVLCYSNCQRSTQSHQQFKG